MSGWEDKRWASREGGERRTRRMRGESEEEVLTCAAQPKGANPGVLT